MELLFLVMFGTCSGQHIQLSILEGPMSSSGVFEQVEFLTNFSVVDQDCAVCNS